MAAKQGTPPLEKQAKIVTELYPYLRPCLCLSNSPGEHFERVNISFRFSQLSVPCSSFFFYPIDHMQEIL